MNENYLQIYYGDLAKYSNRVTEYYNNLSTEEFTRAQKFRFDRDRDVYILSHALLNSKLSNRLKTTRNRLDIRYFDNRKPYIKNEQLDFNLSHSGEYFAFVISNDEATIVGIDIEVIKNSKIDSIVNQYFHKDEASYIYQGKQDALIRFHEIWTRKEAYLKMLGFGLTENLFQINVDPGKKNFQNYFNPEDKRNIHIYTCLKDNFVLSVAVSRPLELIYTKL